MFFFRKIAMASKMILQSKEKDDEDLSWGNSFYTEASLYFLRLNWLETQFLKRRLSYEEWDILLRMNLIKSELMLCQCEKIKF